MPACNENYNEKILFLTGKTFYSHVPLIKILLQIPEGRANYYNPTYSNTKQRFGIKAACTRVQQVFFLLKGFKTAQREPIQFWNFSWPYHWTIRSHISIANFEFYMTNFWRFCLLEQFDNLPAIYILFALLYCCCFKFP